MVTVWIDKTINRIKLQTDDPSVKYLLEASQWEFQYLPWKKKMGSVLVTKKIYDETRVYPVNGIYTFTLGLGWAAYIANNFKNHITKSEYDTLVSTIVADSYRTTPFPELRDYQNEDVLHLLKYKVGLYGVYTSYGKTQIIATLANYYYNLGKSVLIVTPNKKPNEEVVKRCKTVFNLDVPSKDFRINSIITNGLLNRNDIKDPALLKQHEALWANYQVVLCDEVEYTINPGGKFLYDRLTGAECLYGFSGSADKTGGEMITFQEGLSDVVIRNKDLIKYFGPNLIYRRPVTLDIDYITVLTASLNQVNLKDEKKEEDGVEQDKGENVYNKIMTKIWTNPSVCRTLVAAIKRYPKMYIPMNNLNEIIKCWIDNYFIGKFRILLICHEGYVYYDLDGNRKLLADLSEACEYVKNGLVDVIPSTSSGFRALDLPGLENIGLFAGKVAGVTLQTVGRTARGSHMNIITFKPLINKRIPVYSKGVKEREEMIHEYYKYCNIKDIEITEEAL